MTVKGEFSASEAMIGQAIAGREVTQRLLAVVVGQQRVRPTGQLLLDVLQRATAVVHLG